MDDSCDGLVDEYAFGLGEFEGLYVMEEKATTIQAQYAHPSSP